MRIDFVLNGSSLLLMTFVSTVLKFEHKAWQSNQCMYFADIFVEAIQNGLPAIQTQHPGLYYQQVKFNSLW